MWEFDSHLEITCKGKARLVQVWSKPSMLWGDTRDWAITEDSAGRENPPKAGCGHWASTDAFKKAFPNFNRNDSI